MTIAAKTKNPNRRPKAVLISDIHWSLKNLELSEAATKAALDYGAKHALPVIIAGDIHDTKAILRGEVVARMIKTFEGYRKPYILVGNHDRINEKNQAHALEFLRPHARIIDAPTPISELDIVFFPYSHDVEELKADLKNWARAGDTLVMHQGVTAADKGDYIVDKSAIDVELLSNYTVFSGHYHKHQTIGTCTYIGNPFTMSFGEAKDGPKGFLILYSDGTFTRKTLDYRKHVVIECSYDQILYSSSGMFDNLKPNDLVWLKISGPISELNKIKKSELAREIGHMNFKLDKIATEVQQLQETNIPKTDQQILDELIDSSAESADQKKRLKNLWREVIQ